MKVGVFLPTPLNNFAVVYFVMSAVTTKWPCAPEPLACTTRSGIRSRLKCAIFSNNKKSSNTTGPRGPTVSEFWLSPTGRPASVVIFFGFSAIDFPSHQKIGRSLLYFQYIVHIKWIGRAYGTPTTPVLLRHR